MSSRGTPPEELGGFTSWTEVATLLGNAKAVLPAWVHYIAFDL